MRLAWKRLAISTAISLFVSLCGLGVGMVATGCSTLRWFVERIIPPPFPPRPTVDSTWVSDSSYWNSQVVIYEKNAVGQADARQLWADFRDLVHTRTQLRAAFTGVKSAFDKLWECLCTNGLVPKSDCTHGNADTTETDKAG